MLLRRFTDFVLHGRIQAMALAFVCAFIPVISSISILVAALVTLRKGVFEGALVTLAATVPYLLGYFGYSADDRTVVTVLVVCGMIASNILTWGFAAILRRHGNWNLVIEVAGFIGVAIVIAIHLINPDIQSWWQTQLGAYFAKSASVMSQYAGSGAAAQQEIEAQLIDRAKQYATGFSIVSILFNALLQLALARWWQALIFNPGGLQKELWQIRLGYAAAVVFVALFGLAFFGNQMSVDASPVMLLAFCMAGLSLIHCLIGTTKFSWLFLLMVYTGIVFLFPLSAVLISIAALFDTLFNFRRMMGKLDT